MTVLVQVATIATAVGMIFAKSKEAKKHITKAATKVSSFVGSRLASRGSSMESNAGLDLIASADPTDATPEAPTEPDLADAEAGEAGPGPADEEAGVEVSEPKPKGN